MKARPGRNSRVARSARWVPLALALVGAAVHAQYKVVGPDGRVTYTDRPPTTTDGKVTSLGVRSTSPAPDVPLPAELQQAVARYPVTLFVTSSACDPCNSARQLLRQRGIPYNEKLVVTAEDGDALERLSGGRDAPTMTLGGQTLRGLAAELWNSYLDAAGYPRESRLPPGYQYPAATPLTERREASTARPTPPPRSAPAEPEPAPESTAPAGVNIRF
jgi:glutaredoxin